MVAVRLRADTELGLQIYPVRTYAETSVPLFLKGTLQNLVPP